MTSDDDRPEPDYDIEPPDDWEPPEPDADSDEVDLEDEELAHRRTVFEETSRKDVQRGWVRRICKQLHQQYLRTGNPLYALQAIRLCSHEDVRPMVYPDWCYTYLAQILDKVLTARGDGSTYATAIVNALGLTRDGWNARKAEASESRAVGVALKYERLLSEGTQPAQALKQISRTERLGDPSYVAKLVRRGFQVLHPGVAAYKPRRPAVHVPLPKAGTTRKRTRPAGSEKPRP